MTRPTRFTLPTLLAATILLPATAGAAPEKSFDEVGEVIEVAIPVHVVADGQPVVTGAPGSAPSGSPLLPIRLEAGGLAAGDYLLTVSLRPGGALESTRSIPVTIVAGVER